MSEQSHAAALEYHACRYGGARVFFRGPERSLDQPFMACIGGSETYGKFVPAPWPALAEDILGRRLVNFGCMNAGLDTFLNEPAALAAIGRGDGAILQAMDAHRLSNRLYTVHPRRNDRFIRPAPALRDLYEEVDFTEFHFTRHMLSHLRALSAERFAVIEAELREAWLARMRRLARALPEPSVLMVLPVPAASPATLPGESLGDEPLFVTPDLIEEAAEDFTATLTVSVSDRARSAGTEGMVFTDLDAPAASGMPGPAIHAEIAAQLAPLLSRLTA